MKAISSLILGVLVTFMFDHDEPFTFNKIKLYKGQTEQSMTLVKTVDVPNGTATSFSVAYDFTDSTRQVFGVAVGNNFGDSGITTRDEQGGLLVVGKPNAPVNFKVMVSGQN